MPVVIRGYEFWTEEEGPQEIDWHATHQLFHIMFGTLVEGLVQVPKKSIVPEPLIWLEILARPNGAVRIPTDDGKSKVSSIPAERLIQAFNTGRNVSLKILQARQEVARQGGSLDISKFVHPEMVEVWTENPILAPFSVGIGNLMLIYFANVHGFYPDILKQSDIEKHQRWTKDMISQMQNMFSLCPQPEKWAWDVTRDLYERFH